MQVLRTLYTFLINHFSKLQLLIIIVIVVYAFFISESNIFARWESDSQIKELNQQIKHYREKTQEDRKKLEELEADKDQIEKFGRENYLMKKSNEDLFIVD